MADLSTTPVGNTGTLQKNMTIGEMMGLAQNAQAYKQAQQINPLALQQKELELSQAQQINPLALRQQIATTNVAEQTAPFKIRTAENEASTTATNAESAGMSLQQKKANAISNGYVGLINDPLIIAAKNNPDTVDKTKLMQRLTSWGDQQAKAAGVDPKQASELIKPYLAQVETNPAGVRDFLIQRHVAGLGETGQIGSYQTITSVTPDGRTITSTPNLGTQTIQYGLPGGMQAGKAPVTPGSLNTAFDPSTPVQLPHAVRTANQPFIPDPTEASDTAQGVALRQALLGHLNNTAEINRNLDESFSAITKLKPESWYTSGATGTLVRNVSNLLGSSNYQQLSKDLANVQLAQLAAQGGSMQTDAAKSLQARASGSETYNPDVLLNIMRRTAAKQTELQLQAPAIQMFSQKFGDANVAKFQQEWSKNADSKVFEAMNINKNVQDPVAKKRAIDELLGSDPKARKLFGQKYKNINKLVETGSL